MEFGMPFLLETETLEECVQLCSRLGLSFVEWNMNFPQCQLERLDADKLNRLGREFGIYYTLHLDENLNVSDFNAKVRQAYLDTVLESIELAQKIGAPIINMHLAKGIYITLPDRKTYLFAEYEKFYMDNLYRFRELCQKAIGDSNVMIVVENTEGFKEHEKKAVEMLLKSPCFGLTLDIGHSHAVKDVDMPFYEKHGDRLIHMHMHDAKGSRSHLALRDGEIDLRGKMQLARDAGVRVVLETKTVEALTKSVGIATEILRDCAMNVKK